ncbi:DNA-binding transcriptional regulator YiaG [Methylopila capsulata]|uniref:DNA-binding transcriptional regulator YiaG n=1 Tax=Methylopila capsulata TaxID=61654 RepID=A0A9W6MQC5_9HYPH|nr:helix-turn-helix domain-containing protein [Methylopila capsulata]MBM7851477.1 DNA-binding transcriptional regulator YiaG [Methylopila capsulata]GLK54535.1 hypothetical protein GCM10008170_05540 [Methylopila capsulata]
MTSREHFIFSGEQRAQVPYHYRECGLDNVWLENGFTREIYEGEEYVSVHDVDGLWKAIGLSLVSDKKTLSPKEIFFLRRHMKLTQSELATRLRVDDQTVARWEKGKVKLPGPADLALRAAFLGSEICQPEGRDILVQWEETVRRLITKDETGCIEYVFQKDQNHWSESFAETRLRA